MTESKIGHLHSRRDITLLGLTGTDWGGGEGGGGEIQQNTEIWSDWTLSKHWCASVLHKQLFICVSICAKCITDCRILHFVFRCPEQEAFSVPLRPSWETKKDATLRAKVKIF